MAAKKKKSTAKQTGPNKSAPKPAAKKPSSKGAASKKGATKKAASKKGASKRSSGAQAAGRRTKSAESAADARVAEIQRIIDVMVAAGAVEVEMEEAGSKLRVRLRDNQAVSLMPMSPAQAMPVMAPAALPGAVPEPADAQEVDDGRAVFTSPMVGTFYSASSPDAEPYVHIGTRVNEDSTLCILEAMKVMNEIKAETNGEIVEILVQNGEAVEFGQPMFVIKS